MKKTLLILSLCFILGSLAFAGGSAGRTCVVNPDNENYNGGSAGRTCKISPDRKFGDSPAVKTCIIKYFDGGATGKTLK